MKQFKYLSAVILIALLGFTACDDEDSTIVPSVVLTSISDNVEIGDNGNAASANIGAAGGEIGVNVESTVDWYAENTDANWVAVTDSENKLLITVPPSQLSEQRFTKVDIKSLVDQSTLGSVTVTQAGVDQQQSELSVVLDNESDSIFFIGDGGESVVRVVTDNQWVVTTDATWLQIEEDHETNSFKITASSNVTLSERSAFISVDAGTNSTDQVSVTIPVTQLWTSEAMVLTVKVGEETDNMTRLPFYDIDANFGNAMINCIVDWGDGTLQHVLTAVPSHQYEAPGTYVVRIYGTVESFATNVYELGTDQDMKNTIIAINNWGNTGVRSLKNAFAACRNLEHVAEPGENSFAELTSVYYAFSTCESLTEIPAGLFAKAPKLNEAYGVFQSTTNLTAVPDSLFAGRDQLTRITRAFWRSGVQSIGKDVLAGCTALDDVGQAFYQTVNLTSIPNDIFDDSRNITRFSNVFNGCTALEGESPYTIVEGEKVHLYERENYPDIFATPRTITNAFLNSTGLSDYDAIFAAGWAGR